MSITTTQTELLKFFRQWVVAGSVEREAIVADFIVLCRVARLDWQCEWALLAMDNVKA
jgi:hypothetical protein